MSTINNAARFDGMAPRGVGARRTAATPAAQAKAEIRALGDRLELSTRKVFEARVDRADGSQYLIGRAVDDARRAADPKRAKDEALETRYEAEHRAKLDAELAAYNGRHDAYIVQSKARKRAANAAWEAACEVMRRLRMALG